MIKLIFVLMALVSTTVQSQGRDKSSIFLLDTTRNEVVVSSDANVPKSIASITKIMTAMVALDHDRNLDRRILIPAGGKLPAGWHTRRDIMSAMLIRSDNRAADALAADYPGGERAFVRAMNQRARQLNQVS